MLDYIFEFVYNAMTQSIPLALIASFLWGMMSVVLSPCHLSGIPLIVGFITTNSSLKIKSSIFISLLFSVGSLITIATIGFITASIGRIMGDIGNTGNYLIAIIFVIVGLYLMDLINISWNSSLIQRINITGYTAVLIMGLLFGITLGPCTFAFMAPVLSAVYSLSHTNLFFAILLVAAFAIGNSLVMIVAGTLFGFVNKYLNSRKKMAFATTLKKISGVMIILAALFILYNAITN